MSLCFPGSSVVHMLSHSLLLVELHASCVISPGEDWQPVPGFPQIPPVTIPFVDCGWYPFSAVIAAVSRAVCGLLCALPVNF